jgi:hypothetical protein
VHQNIVCKSIVEVPSLVSVYFAAFFVVEPKDNSFLEKSCKNAAKIGVKVQPPNSVPLKITLAADK